MLHACVKKFDNYGYRRSDGYRIIFFETEHGLNQCFSWQHAVRTMIVFGSSVSPTFLLNLQLAYMTCSCMYLAGNPPVPIGT